VSEAGADDGFAINPGWTLQAYSVGREREPVLVIDNVLSDPQALVEAAAATEFSPLKPGGNFYPGVRAPAPRAYARNVLAGLRPLIGHVFGPAATGEARVSCALSLMTLAPAALVVAQRLPHFDTADGGQLAVLHYLCGPDHGGTAFYRHRSTGFETISSPRLAGYVATLEQEVAVAPPAQDYAAGDTPLFEQIGHVGAAFDRLVVYRSRLLHSGDPGPARAFSSDPRRGRLTVNTFLVFAGQG
jgi:hypothetical protein